MSAPKHCATCSCNWAYLEPTHRSQSPSPHTDMINKLDQSIASVRQTLSKLSVRRNTLLPVNRIPAEIILRIFREALSPVSEEYFTALLDLSSTCSYWRKLTLSDPSLWSNITKISLPIVQCMLARSGTVSLYVSCLPDHPMNGQALQELLKEVHRISHFKLESVHSFVIKHALSWLDTDLHLLRFLSVNNRNGDFEAPKVLCNAPNLVSLELFHCSMRDRPPLYAQKLRRLIFHSHYASDDRLELGVWLNLLASLPFLEELDLRNPLEVERGDENVGMAGGRVSAIKSLKRLSLRGGFVEVTVFLTHITFPPEAQTLIHADYDGNETRDVRQRVQACSAPILRILRARTGHTSPRVLILRESETGNDVISDFSPGIDYQWPNPNVFRFVLDSGSPIARVHLAMILGVQSMFSSLDLRTLAIDDNTDAMGAFLRHCLNIEHFALLGPEFGRCLLDLAREPFPERVRMFGGIKTLSLNKVELNQIWTSTIMDVLECTQVSKISIQNSRGVTKETLDTFRQRFEVDWDGNGFENFIEEDWD